MNQHMKTIPANVPLNPLQQAARYVLAAFMLIAGIGHESWARKAFQAQVPDWVPISKDLTVVLSGIVEIGIAGALVGLNRHRVAVGITVTIFFVLIFPGNWAQFIHHRSAFGLNTDVARGLRLLMQPVLVAWVLWATGAGTALKRALKQG